MAIAEYWTSNHGVRIQYLDNSSRGDGMPLLCIPGGWGVADDFRPLMTDLAPRRCLAMTLRGYGKSDAPRPHDQFADHVSDVEAVADSAQLSELCLLGFSSGAPYALGYALRSPERVKGLILCDLAARHPSHAPGRTNPHGTAPPADLLRRTLLVTAERDAEAICLRDQMRRLQCPVLVIRGGKPTALLGDKEIGRYERLLPDCKVVLFAGDGHEVWQADYPRLLGTLRAFLDRVAHG